MTESDASDESPKPVWPATTDTPAPEPDVTVKLDVPPAEIPAGILVATF